MSPKKSVSNKFEVPSTALPVNNLDKEFGVYQLIRAYRKKGHLVSKTNPIRERIDRRANLDLGFFGLGESDLDTVFGAGKFTPLGKVPLKDIISFLKKCYTASVGVQFTYINDSEKVDWIKNEIETTLQASVPLKQKRWRRGHCCT